MMASTPLQTSTLCLTNFLCLINIKSCWAIDLSSKLCNVLEQTVVDVKNIAIPQKISKLLLLSVGIPSLSNPISRYTTLYILRKHLFNKCINHLILDTKIYFFDNWKYNMPWYTKPFLEINTSVEYTL